MVLDKSGNPLVDVKERRDEITRCLEIIGWSWQRLADRTENTLQGAYRIKGCKITMADSDIRWLQSLADAVSALPRPVVGNDPGSPGLERLAAPVTMADEAKAKELAAIMVSDAVEAERDRMVRGLVDVYMSANDLEDAEQLAARWAISQAAEALGLLPQVKAMLRAMMPPPAPAPVRQVADVVRQPFESAI